MHLFAVDANHGFAQTARNFGDDFRVVVVRNRLDDSSRPLGRIARFEDTRTNKDTIHTELHHQSRIGRSRNTASGKVNRRQSTQLFRLRD